MTCYIYNAHGIYFQVPGSMNLEPVKADKPEESDRNHSRLVQQANAAFAVKEQLKRVSQAYREMLQARTLCDIEATKSANAAFKREMEVADQLSANLELV